MMTLHPKGVANTGCCSIESETLRMDNVLETESARFTDRARVSGRTDGMLIINGIVTVCPMVAVGLHLQKHRKTSVRTTASVEQQGTSKKKKSKKSDAVRRAQKKLLNFALAVGVAEFVASLLRVKDSIQVPPLKEGKLSITEWIPVFASIAASDCCALF